jgi:polar amino acid transport system substrate-binding protein
MNGRTARTRTAIGLALALGAFALGACSSDTTSTATPTPTIPAVEKDAALAAQVPAALVKDGVITVGTDASYAPNEFIDTDGKTIVGMDVDLGNAVGQVLGVTLKWQNAPFDSIIPGIQSGKYGLGISSFTANAERQKVVNFATYFEAGTAWAAKTGNPDGIDPDNACGKKIAVQKGTVQVDDITARSKTCTGASKPAITIDQYQQQTEATAAVVSGKDAAMLADSPVTAYAVKQTNGQLELVGDVYDSAPYGMAVPKAQTAFAKAVQGAVQNLIDGGQYKAILDKWGVASGAITTSVVNPAQ